MKEYFFRFLPTFLGILIFIFLAIKAIKWLVKSSGDIDDEGLGGPI